MNRHPHRPPPTGQFDSSADVDLEELMRQVSDMPGPTPEQVAALDRALEPYLGAFASGAPGAEPQDGTSEPGVQNELAGSGRVSPYGNSRGSAASHTGLVSGKLLGAIGAAVVVGAVFWGVMQSNGPELPAEETMSALSDQVPGDGELALRDTQAPPANPVSPPVSTLTGLDGDVQAQALTVDAPATDQASATGNSVVAHVMKSTAAASAGTERRVPSKDVAKSNADEPGPRQSAAGGKTSDWTIELQRLERAEVALKSGRIRTALSELDENQFTALRRNARALKAAALCQGSAAQRQRGAALARKMAADPGSAMLVRRLKACMNGN